MTWIIQPGEGEAQGDLIDVHKYLKGRRKEDGARLLSVVTSARTGGIGHKQDQGGSPEHQATLLCCAGG